MPPDMAKDRGVSFDPLERTIRREQTRYPRWTVVPVDAVDSFLGCLEVRAQPRHPCTVAALETVAVLETVAALEEGRSAPPRAAPQATLKA